MNMGKRSKKKQQQQQQSGSGRAVLVTFYVVRPRRKDGGGASAASSRQIQQHHHHSVHHHHHHHHHHHLHGRSSGETRRGSDRRADLLEYSRQLRATSATRTTTPPHPKPPLPPRLDTKSVSAVRRDDHPAADDDRRLVRQRRLEREPSLQEVRYRCLGYGGDWNWKKVLKLVLPCHSNNSTDHQSSTRSKKRRDSVHNDSKKNSKQAKAWPAAAQLVSKLKANRTHRSRRTRSNGDEGLVKKLFSMFRQKPRPGR